MVPNVSAADSTGKNGVFVAIRIRDVVFLKGVEIGQEIRSFVGIFVGYPGVAAQHINHLNLIIIRPRRGRDDVGTSKSRGGHGRLAGHVAIKLLQTVK